MTSKSTAREAKRFLGVGIATVLLDFFVYIALVHLFGFNEWFKAISFAIGALFAFISNTYFTFSQSRLHFPKLLKFALTYYISMNVNVLINATSLKFFPIKGSLLMTIAFLSATFASAVVNFILLKYFVYRKSHD